MQNSAWLLLIVYVLLMTPVAGEYALACEHAHSCCILLARVDKFLVGGVWHTHIDYDRFHGLVASGGLTGRGLAHSPPDLGTGSALWQDCDVAAFALKPPSAAAQSCSQFLIGNMNAVWIVVRRPAVQHGGLHAAHARVGHLRQQRGGLRPRPAARQEGAPPPGTQRRGQQRGGRRLRRRGKQSATKCMGSGRVDGVADRRGAGGRTAGRHAL